MKEETGMDSRIQPFAEKMRKTYESMEEDFKTVRAGRANPAVLSRVRVEYYGSEVPVSQVGNITVPEARILQIAPWEPSMVKAIIKAINMSDIGINPTNRGEKKRAFQGGQEKGRGGEGCHPEHPQGCRQGFQEAEG